MEKIISLCKRRGFIMPGSDIYGGLANAWDYGPLGAELKKNIKDEWWNRFVRQRTDMVGIDPKIIMNPKVWEASGHIKNFTDPLVECKKCHARFREDLLLETSEVPHIEVPHIDRNNRTSDVPALKCPQCGGAAFTKPKQFNLLFRTFLGPTEEKSAEVYLRGELAQAMFIDFPAIVHITRKHLPFGIAAQGTVFRNEITPGNFIFRTREFDLMEFEYFIREYEWEKWFAYWLEEMKAWLRHLGVREKNLRVREIPDGERAHYSKRTIDIEYEYPFGRKELYGLAYRADFDLKNHQEASGKDMRCADPETGEKFLPHVIEPTFGLDRSVLVALLEAYQEETINPKSQAPNSKQISTFASQGGTSADKQNPNGQNNEKEDDIRIILKFPYWLAPYKAAVLPLSKKEPLTGIAQKLHCDLRARGIVCDYDETQSIGRRYRRQDEIGTPFCITVDFETAKDNAVTVRDRDTMKQERVKISNLAIVLKKN